MRSDFIKNEIISKFSFLAKYGFKYEFMSYEKNEIINIEAFVALIYNKNNYFVIRIFEKYPFEPICFYKLNKLDELNEIFAYASNKEIDVYKMDSKLWEKVMKKNKFLLWSDVFDVVSESIKKQIETNKSFYGITIDD